MHWLIMSVWLLQVLFLALLLHNMFHCRYVVRKRPLKTGFMENIVKVDTVVWDISTRIWWLWFLHNWFEYCWGILRASGNYFDFSNLIGPSFFFFFKSSYTGLFVSHHQGQAAWIAEAALYWLQLAIGRLKGTRKANLEIKFSRTNQGDTASIPGEMEDNLGLEFVLLSSSSALEATSWHAHLIYETPVIYELTLQNICLHKEYFPSDEDWMMAKLHGNSANWLAKLPRAYVSSQHTVPPDH